MIYLDNASTTPCLKESAEIVRNKLVEGFFNPSAKYMPAFEVSKELDGARKNLVQMLGGNVNLYSVVFTGSATEANNLVLSSSLSKHKPNIISVGEHASVFETAKKFQQNGYKISELPLTNSGVVDIEEFKKVMTSETAFISIMLVSNETGATNDIKSIVGYARRVNPKVLIHIDAVQAFCKIAINIEELDVDYVTLSSHKIEGPKGVGALVYRSKCKLEPQILGGGQEYGKRSGTENLPSILGFINSASVLLKNMKNNYEIVKRFRDELITNLSSKATEVGLKFIVNGETKNQSPYILSCGFVGTKGEVLLHALASKGIYVGTGSACNSKHSGNRILSAMGRTKEEVECNIRLSFMAESADEDAELLASTIVELAQKHNSKK